VAGFASCPGRPILASAATSVLWRGRSCEGLSTASGKCAQNTKYKIQNKIKYKARGPEGGERAIGK